MAPLGHKLLPTIAVLADNRNGHHPDPSVRAVEAAGGTVQFADAANADGSKLDHAGGLFLSGCAISDRTSELASALLGAALDVDMPVLATGHAMHVLNACFGGSSPGPVDGHLEKDGVGNVRHQIYLSPGSKMAAIIGSAGMFRVNSRHALGLREPQRAERLMTIAYQLDDGAIEGLESKEHSWVIGVQFLPELSEEVPASFSSLFLGLVERAQDFSDRREARRNTR